MRIVGSFRYQCINVVLMFGFTLKFRSDVRLLCFGELSWIGLVEGYVSVPWFLLS